MKTFLATTSILCTACFFGASAHAQSMNYGVMQEMFGEPVTTSANGSPMRESNVPLNMTIITAEDIERSPAREIPDLLRFHAGMHVRQVNNLDYAVGIRGYAAPGAERLLVLVNGRQVYEDYFGLVNWSGIPVEMGEIRQIEIVRGPNTALFGFNATSGVINIVTYNPLFDDIDYVQLDAGANGYLNGSGAYTFQGDTWAGRISYGNQSINQDATTYNPQEAGFMDLDSTSETLNVDIAMQISPSTQVRMEVSDSKIGGNMLTAYNDGAELRDDFGAVKFSVNSDTDYGIIDAQVYKNSANAVYNTAQGRFGFVNDVLVAQLSDTFKVGTDHTFRIAGEIRNNQTDHHVNGTKFSRSILNIKSLSSLWYWNITDAMALSVAGRYDHVKGDLDEQLGAIAAFNPFTNSQYNNVYDEFGYNVGLVYKPTDVDTLRLTVAKGVDLPSPFELALQAPGLAYGNPQTEVSDVHDFQLGYERSIADWNSTFKATSFYQLINGMQGFAAGTPLVLSNLGDSQSYGLELSLDGTTDNNVRWGVNYNYSQVENIDRAAGNFEDLNSDHYFNANIGYAPNEEWAYDLYGSYYSDFEAPRDYNTASRQYNVDGDVVLDAKITYKPEMFEKLTLSLNGQGLLGGSEQSSYGEELPTQLFLRAKYDL